jgi:hypothetical protein
LDSESGDDTLPLHFSEPDLWEQLKTGYDLISDDELA